MDTYFFAMFWRYILLQFTTGFLAFISGNPITRQISRDVVAFDCRYIDSFVHPGCDAWLEMALSEGLETAAGVEHYCEHIDFYPRCLRRHTNDYKYMHRCGTFGDQTSMPDTDKWFEMITQLQNGFKEVVCDRTAKEFIEAINCYKHNASTVYHACASDIPESYAYFFYENPGGNADIRFESYSYCAFLLNSANCIRRNVNAICGDKTRDLLNDAYRILVDGVFSRAFDCGFFTNT